MADFKSRERIDWIGVLDAETIAAKNWAALFREEHRERGDDKDAVKLERNTRVTMGRRTKPEDDN